jgi:hypothetical protein
MLYEFAKLGLQGLLRIQKDIVCGKKATCIGPFHESNSNSFRMQSYLDSLKDKIENAQAD